MRNEFFSLLIAGHSVLLGGDMGDVKKFEDLVAWQKSRVLVREIYRVTGQGAFAGDFGLKDQMRRAGVSVMSNIAEGYEPSFTSFW